MTTAPTKSYARLLTRLHNAPLLISEDKLRIITEAVTLPLLMGNAQLIDRIPSGTNATVKEFAAAYENKGRKLGIIPVFDSLVSKEVSAGSGMTSYEYLNYQMDAAIAAGFTDIGFYVDSPGGEATGLFGLTEKIRSLSSRGIGTFSFVDNATSAAYAIAAATGKIYASEIAGLGSIAALMVHSEITKAADSSGITYTVFRSKAQKALGDPYTALDDAVKSKFQTILASLDTAFNNDVLKSRAKLSLTDILELEGATIIAANDSKSLLADAIVPNLENALSDYFKTTKQVSTQKSKGVKMEEQVQQLTLQLAEANNKIASLSEQLTAASTSIDMKVEEAVLAERSRCTAILSTAKTLNVSPELAEKHITVGRTAEDSKSVMEEIRTSHEMATAIDSTQLAATVQYDNGTVGDNKSLLANALKKAKGL